MKRAINQLILAFYACGTLCLPKGDFAVLKNLPEMFSHCKATEDRDLSVFEFLTEHVLPIGFLFEGVEHEPEEDGDKPHEPIQTISCEPNHACVISQFSFSISQIYPKDLKLEPYPFDSYIPSGYFSKIFRPPILA